MTATDETTERLPAATPALGLAEWLDAVSAHLRKHPELPPVNVDYLGHVLQIVGTTEWTDAAALYLWAMSFDSAEITAHRAKDGAESDSRITFAVRAQAYSHDFEVWGWLPSDVFYLVAGEHQTVSLDELAELAAQT